MFEHLTDNEIGGLFYAGLSAPALIIGGLASVAAGIYFGMTTESTMAAVIMGGAAFGGGCGLLGVLGFYHWHRELVESERVADKSPSEYEEV